MPRKKKNTPLTAAVDATIKGLREAVKKKEPRKRVHKTAPRPKAVGRSHNEDKVVLECLNQGMTIAEISRKTRIPYWTLYHRINRPNSGFREVIEKVRNAASLEMQATTVQVARELANIGFADVVDLFNDDGSLKPFSEWDEGNRKAVAKIEVDELFAGKGDERQSIGFTKKVTFHSKPQALDQLAKMLGSYAPEKKNVQIEGINELLALINGADTGVGKAAGD